MSRTSRGIGGLVLALMVGTAACSEQKPAAREERSSATEESTPVVAVVNYPLKFFAERIGEERVHVVFPVPAAMRPAFWSPDAEVITTYQAADRVLLNGARYAKWVERASLPPSKVVDTSRSFRERYLPVDGAVSHTHGPEGAHDHRDVASTTWLDLQLAVEQARAVRDALASASPAHEIRYRKYCEVLVGELLALDAALEAAFSEIAGEPLLGSHPVYQYLARRYSLDLESVHFEPGEFPSTEAWRDLEERLRVRPSRWMLWEAEPISRTAEALESLGVGIVVFEPCGNTPTEGDFLTVMRENCDRVLWASRSE